MYLRWKIYAAVYALMIISGTYFSLLPESRILDYYQILILLDKRHWWNLYLFYISCFFEVISLVPLFLFVFRIRWLSQDFWKIILAGRLVGLAGGHNFDYNLIISLIFANPIHAFIAILVTALISLPSFCAQFIYAFRK